MLEKAIDAVNKGKPGAIKTVNTIVNNINKITTGRGKSSQFGKVENSLFKITENVGKEGHTTINKNIYDWKNIHNIIDTKIGPISADNTRLYRVDTTKTLASGKVSKETIEKTRSINDMFHQADNQGAVDAVGRWFNSGPDSLRKASFYLGDRFPSQITSIDVPKTIAKKYTISNLPRAHGQLGKVDPVKYSRDATEVFLPKSIANNKQYVMGANEFVNIVKNNKIKNIFGFSDTLKRIVAHPTIIKSATPAEKKIIEKAVDKVLLNGKTPTKLELNTVNKIVNKYIITPSAKVLNSAKRSKSVKEQNEVFSQFSKTSLTTNKKQIMKAKTDAHFGPNSYNKELSYTVLQEWDDPTIIKKFAIPDDYFKRTMVLVKRGEGTRGKTVASGAIMQDIKKSSGVVKIGDDIYIPSDKLSKMTSKLRGKEVRMTNELDIINKRRSPTNLKYTWNSPYSKRRTVAIITKNIKNTIIPPNVASNIILDGSIGLTKAGKAMPNKGYAGFVREGNLEDIFINRWGATNPKSIARTLSHESEHQAIEMTLLKDNIFNTKAQKFSKSLDTGAYQNKRFIGRMNKKLKSNERIEGIGGKRSEVNMFDSFDMFTPEGVNRKVAIRNAVNQQHKTFIKKEKKIKNIVNGVLSVSGGALPIAIAVAVDKKQRKQQVGTGPPGTTFKSRSSTASRSKKRKSSR